MNDFPRGILKHRSLWEKGEVEVPRMTPFLDLDDHKAAKTDTVLCIVSTFQVEDRSTIRRL